MINKLHFYISGAIFLVLSLFIINPQKTYANSWAVSTIDNNGDVGMNCSLAVDLRNNYLISYSDDGNKDLNFAISRNRGDTWEISKIDSNGWVGVFSSIVVEKSRSFQERKGKPMGNYLISYSDYLNSDLKFAKSVDGGQTWSTNVVDSAGIVGGYSSMTIDAYSNYLISYISYNSGVAALKFAMSEDGGKSWETTVLDDAGDVGYYNSIMVDKHNQYLISYYSSYEKTGAARNLKLAQSNDKGKNWKISTIDSEGNIGQYSSITADKKNNYLVSYYDSLNGDLKLAKSSDKGKNWQIATVDSKGDVGVHTSILVDPYNNYLISYQDDDNVDLKFAKSTDSGKTWKTEVIDDDEANGYYTSLASDIVNNYIISYYRFDGDFGSLKFAKYLK